MNIKQYRDYILIPVLNLLGLNSKQAIALMLGTIAQESQFKYIKQIKGPALGFYQMEPDTVKDLYHSYLFYRNKKMDMILSLQMPKMTAKQQLPGNLYLQAALARLQYYRKAEPLPAYDDVTGLANYWKKYWNTQKGKGSAAQFIKNYAAVESYI